MLLRLIVPVLVAGALLAVACTGDDDAGEPQYLTKVIPACSPIEGSGDDPCEPRRPTQFGLKLGGGGGSGLFDLPEPWDIRWFMDGTSPARATHMVVRGTFIDDTVRCTSGQVARPPSYGNRGRFPGWESIFKCYADLQVREYLVGAGPARVTLMVDYQYYGKGPLEIAHRKYFPGRTLEEAEAWYRRVMEKTLNGENPPPASIFNREQIHFIGPAHDDGVMAWERFETWEVERNDDDEVIVVHPFRDIIRDGGPDYYTEHRNKLEIPLTTFRTEVDDEHQAMVLEYGGRTAPSDDPGLASGASAPTLVRDYHNLANHFEQIGANDHAFGPPEQPPALCSEGAVPDGDAYGWLTEQCARLLQAKDVLRGSANLNWATNTAMASWDGITLADAPDGEEPDMGRRVSGLDLSDEGLNGTIPNTLGMVYTLTVLKLDDNDLTGHLPRELSNLTNLTELKLSGNDFVGCIPEGLSDIADNDLDDLQLTECDDPDAPEFATDDVTFTSATYTFTVPEDAVADTAIGSVLADPGRRGVTYSITAGNDSSVFAIDGESGAIALSGSLDYEATATYTFTVQAAVAGVTSTATVTVAVTDVAEDPPPTPSGLAASLAEGTFTISWDALDGAAKYEAQHTTDAADAPTVTWTALPETTGVSVTYSPTGGPDCGTEYRFRVRAFGDGDAYTEMWGSESDAVSVATATCNPEFGEDSYYFFILDTTAADSAVGTVPATDPDTNDTVSYAITGGNEDGKFAISTTTGQLTSAETFDIASTPYYSLTVEASDGQGGTATAKVTVSLTIAACANGTVVPRPEEYPRLVRDCSVLLTAKDTLRGTASLNWSADIPLRQWQGIYQGYLDSRASLDPATRHVTDVRVSSLGLNGSIPSLLTGLVDLRQLLLDHNALTGGIPAELGDLSGLSYLGLHRNLLTGEIPPELGNLSNLDNLRLHGNQLAGAMPSNLRALGSLRILILNNNRLTGSIPSWLSEMSELRELWLRDNQLTGTIPSALVSLDLDDLHLSGNSFTGCIPAGLRDVADNDMDRLGLPDCSP